MTHELKIWPRYFKAVLDGDKTFEIRKNDRGFGVGDTLDLQEFDPETKKYTGWCILRKITYITDYGQPEGQVVMGIK
jgi:hypothetical protein